MNARIHRPQRVRIPTCAALLVAGLVVSACSDDSSLPGDQDATLVPDTAGDTSEPEEDTSDDTEAPDDAEADTPAPPEDVSEDADADADSPDADILEPEDVETDVGVDIEPERSCEVAADCDDGLTCTTDRCNAEGFCEWTITANTCLIGGRCQSANTVNPNAACEACVPSEDRFRWSPRAAGASCDPGDACVVDAVCTEDGACEGEALTCEDGNDCTENTCDPATGCAFLPREDGATCDDGNLCTVGDVCQEGLCVSGEDPCDDGNPCTANTCEEDGSCSTTFLSSACDDGDACTVGSICVEGECGGGVPRNCDDGNSCTIDTCDSFVGCVHLPDLNPCCSGTVSVCDDDDPCTTDLCDPESASCAYEFNTALCDDGDACTVNNVCADGECTGTPRDCDDGNPCTINTCDPVRGCRVEFANGIPCDNGIDCTFDDFCDAGVCVAGRSECVCEPTFADSAIILTEVAIGTGGVPGQGLDVDRNPGTCSPRGCSDGIDNALSALASLANPPLAEAVAEGSFALLVELDSLVLNPFRMAVYTGDPTDETCDVTEATCGFLVSGSTLDDDTCQPVIALPATRSGSRIVAGGSGTVFPLEVPFGDAILTLTIFNVRFEGTTVVEDGELVSLSGVLAGAVPKQSLIDTINALPDDALPLEKSAIIQVLNILVTNDVDSNGDGTLDAASIGIVLEGTRARIEGVDR